MPNWSDRPRSRVAAGVAGSSLLLAAVLAPLALARTSATHGNGATWNSNGAARSIQTTVYVGAISCSAVKSDQYVGQQSGVELFGRDHIAGRTVHPDDFAGVYSYCHGQTAYYSAQFVTVNTRSGELDFKPAGFPVHPGDPLQLSIQTTGDHQVLTIRDVNTKRHAEAEGPALNDEFGWSAGMTPIDADSSGAPETHGAERLGDEYAVSLTPTAIKGPAPTAPVVFDGARVDGRHISAKVTGTYPSSWKGAGGKLLASVSKPEAGNFTAELKTAQEPRVAKTAEVTPVGGQVTIELPGTHKFVTLANISEIPDGTLIDADHGSIQITLALPDGKSQTGIFYSGEFRLSQRKDGQTIATLAGGSYTGCPSSSAVKPQSLQPQASTARARKRHPKTATTAISGLWANAHGSFTTKGSYGAAAVLGTRWYTENRCDGTYFYVARDKIEVTSYYPTRHEVLVRTGHSYLARAVVPAPHRRLTDSRLGSIVLGESREHALAAYPFGTTRGFTYKYYFKLSEGGIRIGFASKELLRTLPDAMQHRVRGHVVWASTWSSFYAIDGIRVHASLGTLQRRLPGGQLITVGTNDWYLVPFRHNTAVFKVDNDAVSEIGIALAGVTTSRAADRTLMSSFDS